MFNQAPVTTAILVVYFVSLALMLTRRGKPLTHPAWGLFRSFFPNWQFYAKLGQTPKLFIRVAAHTPVESGLTDLNTSWQLVYPRSQRRIWHLWHNPRNNLRLYQQNLLDHLIADLARLQADSRESNSLIPQLNDHNQMLSTNAQQTTIQDTLSYQLVFRWAVEVAQSPSEHGITINIPSPHWMQFCVCQHPTELPVNVNVHMVLLSIPQALK